MFVKQRQRAGEELRASGRVRRDQARTGRRRERNRAQELRVIVAPVAPISIGPRPVEHVLTVGMRLDVERHRADERLAAPRRHIAWRPAGFGCRAARLVQGVQKGVGKERPIADERVPGGARNRAE